MRLATVLAVRASNLGGGEIFRTRPDLAWAQPASYTIGTGFFPGVKRPRRGVNHPPPSSTKVKERVELYVYSPLWAFVACYTVTFNFTLEHNADILNLFTNDSIKAVLFLRS